jgi:glycosyltransferase involved in cell wall biosynthesis
LDHWELLLIDNASPEPDAFKSQSLEWHPRHRIIREDRLGLTHARLTGIRAAEGELLIFVDDDNVVAPNYVRDAVAFSANDSKLGALGGKALPEWETLPDPWVHEFASCLALRDLGNEKQVFAFNGTRNYPDFAPIGAGMCLRRDAAEHYARVVGAGNKAPLLDRCGTNLTSGGDNDIVLTVLAAGWKVGYFPSLQLTHLIPSTRITRDYLARINESIARSWVQVLDRHGLRPWGAIAGWSLPVRKLRAFMRYRAWRSAGAYVRWRGACGQFEGRANLLRERT